MFEARKKWFSPFIGRHKGIAVLMTIVELPFLFMNKNLIDDIRENYDLYRNDDMDFKICLVDILYNIYARGISPKEYFQYGFWYLNERGRNTFICQKEARLIHRRNCDEKEIQACSNKSYMANVFKEYYGRDVMTVNSHRDYKAYIDFVRKHKKIVLKPFEKYGGEGIRFIDTDCIDIDELFQEIITSGGMQIEEKLEQSNDMSALHNASVNTVRVVTTIIDKKPNIMYMILRTGVNGSSVDNACAGGIYAQIDTNIGIVDTNGLDENGNQYKVHPNSKIRFNGFEIPKFDELKNIVLELAKILPNQHIVGWDMAHTEKGWVCIECNRNPKVFPQEFQFVNFKGIRKQYDKLLEYV